jgi:hypothetical protein
MQNDPKPTKRGFQAYLYFYNFMQAFQISEEQVKVRAPVDIPRRSCSRISTQPYSVAAGLLKKRYSSPATFSFAYYGLGLPNAGPVRQGYLFLLVLEGF